ncbi:MAG: nucleoside deaminase [Acidobacteriota bacterium]
MTNDETIMRHCLKLARGAFEAGDAPVGCLIMLDGKVISDGIESVKARNDPTAHAEIVAVRDACEKVRTLDLSRATLYTNVEPCVMCSFAIRQAGIGTVVYGLDNLQVGGASSRFAVLTDPLFPAKNAPPKRLAGVLATECERLWKEFEKHKTIKRGT